MNRKMAGSAGDPAAEDPPDGEGLTEEELEILRASYERNRKAMERLAEL